MKVLRPKSLKQRADLYQFVFGSHFVRYVIAVMVFFFLLHPVMPVFAAESPDTETVPQASEDVQPKEELIPEVEPVPEPAMAQESADSATQSFVGETSEQTEVAVAASLPEEGGGEVVTEVEETDQASQPALSDTMTTETPVISAEIAVTPEVTPGTTPEPVLNETTPTESVVDTAASTPDSEEETATTTVPEPEFFEVPNMAEHTDNLYQFTKQQCVSMGDGAYHCFEAKTETLVDERGSLYVAQDADGDKEIYLTTDSREYAITDNKLDDDAPHYDAVSDSIVWHRLVDGRYQVLAYQDKNETVLSGDFENSMEPHRAGAYTVWQSWVQNSWQVVLYDGKSARVISTSNGQNIAPQVEGDYVIWNVTDGVTHKVAVYEIATGLVSIIDDEEGARVYNPRFVLVYDTKFDNGDVITKGYDAETGDIVPLAAAAPAMPEELPQSDQTGETRALLQNKSPSRDDANEELDTSESANTSPVATTSAETLEENGEVLIPDISIVTTIPNLPLTDFDIIVEPFTATTSTQE